MRTLTLWTGSTSDPSGVEPNVATKMTWRGNPPVGADDTANVDPDMKQ